MQYGTIPGIDKPVARVVQGLAGLTTQNTDFWFPVMDSVVELGGNMFDLGHVYGNGECERAFGLWLKERGNRDQIIVQTKGAHHNADRQRVTPFDITADIHDSLARLKVEHIDLYILHRDDESQPVGPIVEVLNQHNQAGKIGAFGGSNWSAARIQAANDYAKANGLLPFVIGSNNFSLAPQIKEPWARCVSISNNEAELAFYRKTQLPLLPWSSLAGGFFSGRFRRDNLDTFTEYLDKLCVECYCSEENFERLDRAEKMAAEKGVTVTQIAMAFIANQGINLFALTQARNQQEFEASIAARDMQLTQSEADWLNLKR
ncbi:MAG: aldo/keto reductase [Caldilineaceae bacterium]